MHLFDHSRYSACENRTRKVHDPPYVLGGGFIGVSGCAFISFVPHIPENLHQSDMRYPSVAVSHSGFRNVTKAAQYGSAEPSHEPVALISSR